VDYANAVFGMPDGLHATGRSTTHPDSFDVIHACFNYNDGPQVHLHAGWSTAQVPFQAGFDAWFEKGFMRFANGELTVFDNLERIEARPADYEPNDAYHNEIAYLLHCVETGKQPVKCMPESTKDSITLIEREIESIRNNSE